MPEPGGVGRGEALPPPQFLADQLTLFQPGKGRLYPPITTGTPGMCLVKYDDILNHPLNFFTNTQEKY